MGKYSLPTSVLCTVLYCTALYVYSTLQTSGTLARHKKKESYKLSLRSKVVNVHRICGTHNQRSSQLAHLHWVNTHETGARR